MTDAETAEIAAPDANVIQPPEVSANAEVPETGSETDSSPVVTDTDDASKPKGVGKRIDELTRNWRETERDRDYWRELALRGREPPKPEPQPEAPAKMPTLEEHGYDESKYQAALIEFTRAEARREAQALIEKDRAERSAQERKSTFEKRQADFMAKKPDYADKVLRDSTLPISPKMAELIQESDMGPDVAYYLAENRQQAEAIARMPVNAAVRELGRIEGRLAAQAEVTKPPPPKPQVSQAPPPPPKIEATEPTVRVRPDLPESDKSMSDSEWVRARNKQLARKG